MTQERLVGIGGLVAWLMVGAPVLIQGSNSPSRFLEWLVAFLLFGALFVADLVRPSLPRLALAGACVVTLVLLLCDGFEGALLVLVAMRLGGRVSRGAGLAWILVQTLLLAGAVAIHWSPRPAVLLTPPYLGFQVLAFFTFEAMTRETEARHATARVNAELAALQEIVADSGRVAERLRIAHELHDALGHHLTAMTLNLEAALRRTEGEARQDVEIAQGLARKVLADVRSIVADKRSEDGVDLAHALKTLVDGVPRPRVHLHVDSPIRVDAERGHILLRCAQEIVTNAARHSGAKNLWIAVHREDGGVTIRARDDGRGSERKSDGFGLSGMRSRVEGAGGTLTIATERGQGFAVEAYVPLGNAS
jgi:signal transduction histidine kinase